MYVLEKRIPIHHALNTLLRANICVNKQSPESQQKQRMRNSGVGWNFTEYRVQFAMFPILHLHI